MKNHILALTVLMAFSSAMASQKESPFALDIFAPAPIVRMGPDILAEVTQDLAAVPNHPLSFKTISIIENGIVQITRVQKTGNIMRTKLSELSAEQTAYIRELSDEADSSSEIAPSLECQNKITTQYFKGLPTAPQNRSRYYQVNERHEQQKFSKIAETISCGTKSVSNVHRANPELVRILDTLLMQSGAN